MSGITSNVVHPESPPPSSLAYRAGLFGLFLACGLVIFVFGTNYYRAFPTNGSLVYAVLLTAVFLAAALLFRRSPTLARYWQIAYAFFVAAAVNLVSVLFVSYNLFVLALGLRMDTNPGLAFGKLYDAGLVILTILVLTRLAGADLGSLFIKKGSLKGGLGIGALVLFNFATSAFIFHAAGYNYNLEKLGSAFGWGALFAFSNSFLEELWFRGLFLNKLLPFLGRIGTILLTTTWFAALHLMSVAYLPVAVLPLFLVNTFTLGLGCCYLTLKADSIWGAVLIHAAADLYLFVATLAFR